MFVSSTRGVLPIRVVRPRIECFDAGALLTIGDLDTSRQRPRDSLRQLYFDLMKSLAPARSKFAGRIESGLYRFAGIRLEKPRLKVLRNSAKEEKELLRDEFAEGELRDC